jgi:hypothetical protein
MRALLLVALLPLACNETSTPTPTAAPAETASPADAPLAYRVLADETNRSANTVDFHVLVAGEPKHDAVDTLLKYLYRHLMQRREDAPAGIAAYVYTSDVQYRTPPRSPIASVLKRPEDHGPSFDNRVPLEFWQQVEQALPHTDKGWKLEKKIERDDAQKTLTITQPFTEPGEDRYADKLSFNLAMNVFTDTAQALFEKVPELKALTFIGVFLGPCPKGRAGCEAQPVVKVMLDRADYQALKLNDVEEQIGQLHGRAFLELASNKGSDATVSKANAQRMASVYRKMLAQLKGKATISSSLK